MWRRWAVSLGLLAGLLAGCHHDSPGRAAPSTTRSGDASSTTTTPASPPGSAVLGGWFSSDQDGWVIAEEPCARPGDNPSTCAVVSKTSDGGGQWTHLAAVDAPGPKGALGPDFVSAVRFADQQHGWAYDRSLFATFNGGKRWQPVDLGNPVVALETVGSQAYALVGACGNGAGNCTGPMRVAEGTIATGRWRFAGLGFDLPDTDTGTLIANRTGVYALVIGHAGEQILLARTGAGRWERRTPPCPRALVAAIETQDGLVAACRPPGANGPTELQTSSDGGRTWAVVWQQSFPSPLASLAVTTDAAVVGLENGDVLRSADNGMHFSAVLETDGSPGIRFTDAQHGFVTTGPASGRRLFDTRDGGATWRPLRLPG